MNRQRSRVRAVNAMVSLWLANLPASVVSDLARVLEENTISSLEIARDLVEENGGQRTWTDFLATDYFIPF